jgi:Arc-like DNA binding domain
MNDKPKVAVVTTSIRLPKDVKRWVEKEARRTGASQNSEIVRCIRGRMASEGRETRTSA